MSTGNSNRARPVRRTQPQFYTPPGARGIPSKELALEECSSHIQTLNLDETPPLLGSDSPPKRFDSIEKSYLRSAAASNESASNDDRWEQVPNDCRNNTDNQDIDLCELSERIRSMNNEQCSAVCMQMLDKAIEDTRGTQTNQLINLSLLLFDHMIYLHEMAAAVLSRLEMCIYNERQFPSSAPVRQRAFRLCGLLSAVLLADWPAKCRTTHEHTNPLLHVCDNSIKTWVELVIKTVEQLNEATNGKKKQTNTKDAQSMQMVDGLCQCLCAFSSKAGRALWLSWPDLCDSLWQAADKTLTAHTLPIRSATKKQMLKMYVALCAHVKPGGCHKLVQTDADCD